MSISQIKINQLCNCLSKFDMRDNICVDKIRNIR